MSLAYHLLTHKCIPQVERLLNALWHPDYTYIIHHDRRRPRTEHQALAALARSRPNIIIQEPTAVLWGRFSLHQAQREGLRLAFASGRGWTHWINLSGQCFPLRSPQVIANSLAAIPHTSFLSYFQPLLDGPWQNPSERLQYKYLDSPTLDYVLRLPGLGRRLRAFLGGPNTIPRIKRRQPILLGNIKWYGGSNWVALSRIAAQYWLHNPAAQRVSQIFRDTASPEESIIQSVILNALEPARGRVVNADLRAIFWSEGAVSPNIIKTPDHARLSASAQQGCLFARKFDLTVDAEILRLLENDLIKH
jgi:Core-2/I-Branching enzyme